MKTVLKSLIVLLLVADLTSVGYAFSGLYNVAASTAERPFATWVLTTVRDHSIDRQSAGIVVPPLSDPKLVDEGFEHYHEMCTGCHLAPGMTSSEIRAGLNPQPPVLAEVVPQRSPARLFWVIKNGVRMTGMPAWGASHSDEMIWAMVAFLEKLPTMTPAQYQAMEKRLPDNPDHDEDASKPGHS